MKNYLYCVFANKATFVGYICLILFLVVNVLLPYFGFNEVYILSNFSFIFLPLSVELLVVTLLGFDTYLTYKRTYKMLENCGVEKVKSSVFPRFYCSRCGYNLAIKHYLKIQKIKS